MKRILIVEDESINRMIIVETLSNENYHFDEAEDGEIAWARLQNNNYDLVVLDRTMPRVDGMELLKRIKSDKRLSSLPVIMQTSSGGQKHILEGIEAGAYYYLTKPYEPLALRMLISSLFTDQTEIEKLRSTGNSLKTAFTLFRSGSLQFRTLTDARHIAAAMSGLCENHEAVALGLLELLVNAVEHGNLGISYQEKSNLRLKGCWGEEIERRLATAPWTTKQAELMFQRVGNMIEFTITDEGSGFDWKPYLEFDPDRAFDLNGRGIAIANQIGFASLEYQGNGNIVVARAIASEV